MRVHDWPGLGTIIAAIYASRENGLTNPILTYVKCRACRVVRAIR